MPELRYRLPLFPLPVVLLPGVVMPLHIFEQRYRDMVADVLTGDRRFGLIYHDWDEDGPFLADSGEVGCVAEIQQCEELEDGRYLLIIKGLERFVIDEGLEQQALYFESIVTSYEDESAMQGAEMAFRRRESMRLFEELIGLLPERPDRLPELSETEEVSFLIAQTIQMELPWHQRMLKLRDEGSRLERIDQVLRAVIRREGS
ncbi:MAG: LON peptidase substrate-binding domain-containing protein [Longimicrobiales bacterium]|jgi:Lon protease-like protein|nr:LON peptidase substrate-binding domain-containing protein [Longimicrobiales bacterium]